MQRAARMVTNHTYTVIRTTTPAAAPSFRDRFGTGSMIVLWLERPAVDVQAAAEALRLSAVRVAEVRQLALALEVELSEMER